LETIASHARAHFAIPILQVEFYKSNFTSQILQVQFYKSNFTIPIFQVEFYNSNITIFARSITEQMPALVQTIVGIYLFLSPKAQLYTFFLLFKNIFISYVYICTIFLLFQQTSMPDHKVLRLLN
jgi:hypothetical protein